MVHDEESDIEEVNDQNQTPIRGAIHRTHKRRSIAASFLDLVLRLLLVTFLMACALALTHFPWEVCKSKGASHQERHKQ